MMYNMVDNRPDETMDNMEGKRPKETKNFFGGKCKNPFTSKKESGIIQTTGTGSHAMR